LWNNYDSAYISAVTSEFGADTWRARSEVTAGGADEG
jgi:hypothetical protein